MSCPAPPSEPQLLTLNAHTESPSPGYETCETLLNSAGGSALFEIPNIDLNKLVIGKPALSSGDASSGYIDPSTLAGCLEQAKAKGWGTCRFAGSLWHVN